ncbi:hypothetical protein [Streptomyces avermitilis]|uniref:hypothetical protein n=1 Tax=Streptomyces avermitilis TaxID=33903 RepID=UPI00382BDB97
MNATPQSPQSSEREELFRLLPAPADPDLPRDRHRLLKEHLMNHVQEETRLATRRWRLATRIAAPVALAAAAAGIAVNVGQQSGNADTVAAGPDRISNVAYTLDREANSTVRMSMQVEGGLLKCVNGKCTTPGETFPGRIKVVADAADLQADLNRMGVHARVYREGSGCVVVPKDARQDEKAGRAVIGKIHRENNQLITAIHRDKLPKNSTLLVTLPSKSDKGYGLFGVEVYKGDFPACHPDQNK